MQLAIIRIPSADVELIRVRGDFAYPWHSHTRHWVLGAVAAGSCTVETSEATRRPTSFAIPPLTGHALAMTPGAMVITVTVGPETLRGFGADATEKAIRDAAVQAGWSATWLASLTPAFAEAAAAEPVRSQLVTRLLSEVVDADADPTVPEVAAMFGMSPAYLSRVCAASTGLPPHRLLMQHRLRRAQAYLADGMTPADAGHLAGFYDQSHLSREFRRAVGVTPRSYQTIVDTV